jgi:hypothetical protein
MSAPGFDCGQCGGQCDTCRRAEQQHIAGRRRIERRRAVLKWCSAPFSELDRYEAGSGALLLLLLLVVISITAERIERVFAFFDLVNSMGVK